MQLLQFLGSKIEMLLIAVVIILQLLLIFLVLQRQYRLAPESLSVRQTFQFSKEPVETESLTQENLWESPSPATEDLKLAIAEFKSQYDGEEPWDGDFVL